MKKFLTVFVSILISIGVYTFCSYTHTFQVHLVTHISFIGSYLLMGFLIRRFYNNKLVIIPFIFVTSVLILSVLWSTFFGGGFLNAIANSVFLLFALSFGYYYSIITFKKSVILSILFAAGVISWTFLFPNIIFSQMVEYTPYMPKKIDSELSRRIITDQNKNEKELLFVKGKVYLLEFYKRYCIPCIQKQETLNELVKKVNYDDFEVIYLQTGMLDSFESYLEVSNEVGRVNRYYDNDGEIGKLFKIEGYPTEYLIDKKGEIRFSFVGFGTSIEDEYLKNNFQRINLLLSEN